MGCYLVYNTVQCRKHDIKTKGPKGLAKFVRLGRGFVIRFFSIHFTIPKVKKKIVRYTEDFLM